MPDESPNAATSFHQLHRTLWDRLVDLCLAQIANRHIRPSGVDALALHTKAAMDMRESLEYRFSAIGFHLGILREYQHRSLKEIADQLVSGNPDPHDIVYTARRQQQMVFDAVIFNILALFDYVGNAIGFSYHGANSAGAKWKWKRAVQYARDAAAEERKHGSYPYARSPVAPLVDRVHREWVDRLDEYRAELIHYKADPAGGGHGFRLAQNEPFTVSLRITTPASFTKWLSIPGKARGERVLLLEAADWLVLNTHSAVLRIVDALTTELEQEPAPPDGGLRVYRRNDK